MKKTETIRFIISMILAVFTILPITAQAADLTIGNDASTNGNWTLNGTMTATSFSGSGSGLTSLSPGNISAGTAAISITGNAATVTNGIYTTGSYSDPSWITSLSGSKVSGAFATGAVTNDAIASGAVTDAKITGPISTSKISNMKVDNSNENTAFGAASLASNTSGSYNTAIGASSLVNNTTGYNNTAIGIASLYSNTTGDNNTAFGVDSLSSNTTGDNNTAFGVVSLASNTTGAYNTAFGFYAGSANSTGTYNTFVGNGADVLTDGLNNAMALGYGAIVDTSNHVRIGDTNVTQIGGEVAWSNLSDIRVKKDIRDIDFGLDFIKSLRPVEYRMKNGNDRKDFGFIAQEIEALVGPDYNLLGIGGDADRSLSLRYTDFIAPMVKAMQEQQEIIEAQKGEIQLQGERIIRLEKRLSRLEALLGSK